MKKAVFLDRDGTINEDVGFLSDPEKLVFIPGALEALRILREDYLLFIITNQPGIERGAFSEEKFLEFSRCYEQLLADAGISIRGTFYCPHKKETNCVCIKPGTFFIEKIQREFPIDVKKSFVIGDHPHDIEMGLRAGSRTAYLLTGHGRLHLEELEELRPDIVAGDILEAARRIKADYRE